MNRLWRDLGYILGWVAAVTVVTVVLAKLLELAVLQVYPDINPDVLQSKLSMVMAPLTALFCIWWFRRR